MTFYNAPKHHRKHRTRTTFRTFKALLVLSLCPGENAYSSQPSDQRPPQPGPRPPRVCVQDSTDQVKRTQAPAITISLSIKDPHLMPRVTVPKSSYRKREINTRGAKNALIMLLPQSIKLLKQTPFLQVRTPSLWARIHGPQNRAHGGFWRGWLSGLPRTGPATGCVLLCIPFFLRKISQVKQMVTEAAKQPTTH